MMSKRLTLASLGEVATDRQIALHSQFTFGFILDSMQIRVIVDV